MASKNIPVNGWPQLKDLDKVQPILNRLDKIEAWKRTVKEETFTGDDFIIPNALKLPARSLKTTIEVIQDLHGYDKPWVGGAGKNKFDFEGWLTANNVTFTKNGNAYTFAPTMALYSNPFIFSTTDAVFSISLSDITGDGTNLRFDILDANGTQVTTVNNTNKKAENITCAKLRLNFSTIGTTMTISSPQVESGSTATSYAPYSNICPISGRDSVAVDDTGRNQLPLTVASIKAANTGGTWSGNAYTYRGIVYTLLTDSADNITGINVNGNNTGTTSADLWIPVNQTIDGILNGCPSGGSSSTYLQTVWSDQGGHVASDTGSGVSVAGIAITSMSIRVRGGVSVTNKVFYPMIRLTSDTDPTFVPYAHSSATIQLGTTVYGADINWDTGVMTVTHGFKTLSGGSEAWEQAGTDTTGKYRMLLRDNAFPTYAQYGYTGWPDAKTGKIISNRFEEGYVPNEPYQCKPTIMFHTSVNLVQIYSEQYQTVESWKTYLASNPLQVCYELATPQTIQLTPTQLQMLKGYNRVTLADGYGTMELKALTGANWS